MLCAKAHVSRLAALLVLVVAPACASAAPAAEAKKNDFPAEKVRKALDQTIDVDIAEQPLINAINQLKEQTKVNLVLDTTTLVQNGIDANTATVSVKQTGAKARTALRAVLGQFHLSYAILGDTVLITTEDVAIHRQFKQKVNVDADKTPFETVLKDLGRETAVQILVDKKVAKEAQTPVSLQLEDVPLETAVRLLCEQAELKPVRMGNLLYITTVAKAKDLRSEPDLAPSGNPGFPGGPPVPIAYGAVPTLADPTAPIPPPVVPPKDP
jgi:hypothetical protein